MKILFGSEAKKAEKFFEEAEKEAKLSLCLRAHCGAVIVKDDKVIGRGFNSPPKNNSQFRTCLQEYDIPAGFRHDRTCCIHAEQRAIENARSRGHKTERASIYFTRLDENQKRTPSNRLCCTICSRAVLDASISEFILEWEDGTVRTWPADEFNKLSHEYKTPILKK